MTIQRTWVKKPLVRVRRVVGTLKWIVLHTQMTRVLMQIATIPNVPRCFGSPIHKYVGLPGMVPLVAGFSIYFVCQYA